MLVLKKISPKKLAIYISIILFMIFGTGIMLYENKNLSSVSSGKVNTPIIFNNYIPVVPGAIPKNNGLGAGGTNNQASQVSNKTPNFNNPNQNGGLNLNIFSSEKFINLQANSFVPKEQLEVGKRDPFKSN